MKDKCIVFGAGRFFESYVAIIEDKYTILAVADNDLSLVGKNKCGYNIISPGDINRYNYDTVLICITEPRDVQQQLIDNGIENISLFIAPGLVYYYGEKNIAKEIRSFVRP